VIAPGHEQEITRASARLAGGECVVDRIGVDGDTVTTHVTCASREYRVLVLPVEPSEDAGRRRASGDLWVLVTPDEAPWVDDLLERAVLFAAALPAGLYIASSAAAPPNDNREPGFDQPTTLGLIGVALLLLVVAFVRRGRGEDPSKPSALACLLAALYLLGSATVSDCFPFSMHRVRTSSQAPDSAQR
jgi:hypothetical protein